MDMQKLNYWTSLVLGTVMGIASFSAQAGSLNLSTTPLFLVNQVKPSVMVMLDNSGSMKNRMYKGSGAYDNTRSYHGIFKGNTKDPSTNVVTTYTYTYDSAIPVDVGSYNVPIDTSVAGAFKETACTLGTSGCWSGNFLNWVTDRRIDSTRMVLVGGKIENRAGVEYGAYAGISKEYKILGNNEPSDKNWSVSYAGSSQFSDVPDGKSISVVSPAQSGNKEDSYKPYGEMIVGNAGGTSGIIEDNGGTDIGEFGEATVKTTIASDGISPNAGSWKTVTLQATYSSTPIIVAKPPHFNGPDPGLVRIRNVTTTSFQISFQEWDYKDGNHTTEQIPYMVFEPGNYTLPGGIVIEAGAVSTDKIRQDFCSGSTSSHTDVSFNTSFSATPVVITSINTFNGKSAANSRIWSLGNSGFDLALQEEQAGDGIHSTEVVGYVAMSEGRYDSTKLTIEVGTDTFSTTNNSTNTINFTSAFPVLPRVVAAMQTMNDKDPAVLRKPALTTSSVDIIIEEEKSCDGERDHGSERVGFIAIAGEKASVYNVAVVVPALEDGVLQKVKDDVRMGISFYRYNPARGDIYNGNTIPGGTMKFKIPNNPFVKKPTAAAAITQLTGGLTDAYRETVGYVGTGINEIIDGIENYPLVWGTTPLAENLWEVIQYFEQDNPYYTAVTAGFEDFDLADNSNPERDPFYDPIYSKTMECAKSNVLIFTDGEPYKDADIPASLLDYDGGSNTATDTTDCTIGGAERNKDCTDTDPNAWGHDNLDDVAYWAYCNAGSGTCLNAGGVADSPSRDLRNDLTGDQYIRIDTVGFANGTISGILQDTADNGGGTAYAASDGGKLASTLVAVFADIASGSAASVAVTSGSLQSTSKLYLARFDSTDWSGDLLAFAINADGTLESTLDGNGLMQPGANGWKASGQIPAAGSRVIFTHNGLAGASQAGVPFQWASLSPAQQGLLGATEILSWLRGDQSEESSTAGSTLNLRDRSRTVLGDIIHSSPAYVGAPDFRYPDAIDASSNTDTVNLYSTFRTTWKDRTPVLYAGANDGLLHAFNADTGAELFSYVPNAVYPRLAALTSRSYVHQYTVDGPPIVVDAYLGSTDKWRTVLASGLRGGGQAVFALDVTDPDSITTEATGAGKVLFEFTDADDADLGYTFSNPNIVRLQNGDWAAIFGNGYNNNEADGNVSTTGNAVLYIVKLSDGSLIKKIDTLVGLTNSASGGHPNGLATVAPTDVDGDSIADYVYGGDLYGNLWKFDLTDPNPTNWGVMYGSPLYTACTGATCTDTNRQPITVRPQVSQHPSQTGYMVYFGTGKYMEDSDNDTVGQLTQTFYGIWDENLSTLTAFNKGNLRERKILGEITATNFDLRVTSGEIDTDANGGGIIQWGAPTNEKGWYMDLILQGTTASPVASPNNYGERVFGNPVFRQGRIIFTTLLPSTEACEAGGSGWLMELDAYKGTRLNETPFDINGDGIFDDQDLVPWDSNGDGVIDGTDNNTPTSGIRDRTVGIIQMPGIIANKDGDKEYKYVAGSSGNVGVITERPEPGASGRQSWRQIR